MNKKMMALIMSALMVMAAFVIVVSVPSDAAGTGTEADPKYIIGTDTDPVVVYNGDVLRASIEFNRGAFTDGALVSYSYVKISGDDITLDYGKIDVDATVPTTGKGYVTIGTTTPFTAHGKIVIKVKDTVNVPTAVDPVPLPEQKFYYAVNVDVRTFGDITLWEGSTELGKDGGDYKKVFNFEESVDITTKMSTGTDFKYYAAGLPKGISMRVDGHIGGKISNELSEITGQEANIYAVSDSGKVVSIKLKYDISAKPDMGGDFTMKVDKDGSGYLTVNDGGYITIESTDVPKLMLEAKTGYTMSNAKVIGYDGSEIAFNVDHYDITNGGTGTFVVKVSADFQKTGGPTKVTEVTKTFTVYVVGKIVDVDLDPAVVSI